MSSCELDQTYQRSRSNSADHDRRVVRRCCGRSTNKNSDLRYLEPTHRCYEEECILQLHHASGVCPDRYSSVNVTREGRLEEGRRREQGGGRAWCGGQAENHKTWWVQWRQRGRPKRADTSPNGGAKIRNDPGSARLTQGPHERDPLQSGSSDTARGLRRRPDQTESGRAP